MGRVRSDLVHLFDLAVGRRGGGQAALDAVLAPDAGEHVKPVSGGQAGAMQDEGAEPHAVVGEHGVDPIGDRFDQALQEADGNQNVGLLVQLGDDYFEVNSARINLRLPLNLGR